MINSITRMFQLSFSREAPQLLLFDVFGLVFESLASTPADSTASPEDVATVTTALDALRTLVTPTYSGKAIFDPPVFDEVRSLFYRLAMTAVPSVQQQLVGVVAELAKSQADRLRGLLDASR